MKKILLIALVLGLLFSCSFLVLKRKKSDNSLIELQEIEVTDIPKKSLMFEPPKRKLPSEYKIGVDYNRAMKSKNPFIALFFADWCGYCVRFMPKYQKIADKYKSDYNFVMINVDDPDNKEIIEEYIPSGFPSLFIIDPSINNRFVLNNGIFDYEDKLFAEFDRYLRIKSMIKQD